MAVALAPMLRATWRIVAALGAGIACGALLVAAFIHSAFDGPLLLEGLVLVSLLYGAAIAAVCAPIWLILAKIGWDGAWAAAGLGFVATAMFFGLTFAAGSHDRLDLMANTIVPYGACGAVAALVTWWVGHKMRRD